MRLSIKLLGLLALPSIIQLFSFALLGNLEESGQRQLMTAAHARLVSNALDNLLLDVYQTLRQHSNERDLELDAKNPWVLPIHFRKLDSDIRSLEVLVANDESYLSDIRELRSMIIKITAFYTELVKNFAAKKNAGFVERKSMWAVLAYYSRQVTTRTSELFDRERAVEDAAARDQQKNRNTTRTVLYVAALVSFISILAVSLLVMRRIVDRINVLVENTKLLANDKKLNAPLEGSDELSLLDKTFHEMAESIREANYRERAVLLNALDAILVLDENLQIVKCNPATIKLFRTTEKDLTEDSISHFVRSDQVSLLKNYFDSARSFASQNPLQLQICPPHLSPVDTLWTTRWSEKDKRFFCVAHDVTERVAIEKLRDEAISMLNHDLRSPLTSIQLSFELILQTLKSTEAGEEVRLLVERSYRSCSKLLDLTNELLDWDRYRSGQVKLRRSKCDLAQIVLVVGENLEPQFKSKSIKFIADLDSVFVDGDGVELERVVLNLLSNCIKFSPPGSSIQAKCSVEGDYGQVSIRDEGPGIAETKLDKIFDRYFQLEQQKSGGEGFGLGLAICRLIVEMHGGKIWAQSKMGKGSEFLFQIPICQKQISEQI